MALADTVNAIGMVTKILEVNFKEYTGIQDIKVGRPQQAADQGPCLNVFLYEISFDPYLKNTSLNEGEKPPLWMVLKYLVTVFSDDLLSDSFAAHKMLGKAIKAMSRDDFMSRSHLLSPFDSDAEKALGPNPSHLHVSFDESQSDLIAKLMQGPDDNFRLSVCFEIRPVMIAPAEPGDYSLLVGVDYTSPPPNLADPYVGIGVIASMGSVLERIFVTQKDVNGNESETGAGFEVGEEVTITGTDLHLANLSVMLGAVELPVTMQQPNRLKFKIDQAILAASGISAGSYPVTVVQTVPATGKKRKSNVVIGNLLPILGVASIVGPVSTPATKPTLRFANIKLDGTLLGKDSDDVIVAFFRDGVTHGMCDEFIVNAAPLPLQPSRILEMKPEQAVKQGVFRLILIVNGQQARQSPEVTFV